MTSSSKCSVRFWFKQLYLFVICSIQGVRRFELDCSKSHTRRAHPSSQVQGKAGFDSKRSKFTGTPAYTSSKRQSTIYVYISTTEADKVLRCLSISLLEYLPNAWTSSSQTANDPFAQHSVSSVAPGLPSSRNQRRSWSRSPPNGKVLRRSIGRRKNVLHWAGWER